MNFLAMSSQSGCQCFSRSQTSGDAKLQETLGRRSRMLKTHQILGLATTVPMLAAVFTGEKAGYGEPKSKRNFHAAMGMTAGVAPYVRHPDDIRLLLDLHRRYAALAASVKERGGATSLAERAALAAAAFARTSAFDATVAARLAAIEPAALAAAYGRG